jgi:ABC-type transport system involved in cytochrome bd biosynthesis fused ATPase/permease subunit
MSYLNVRMSNFLMGTVKNNIILDSKFDQARFNRIVKKLNINLSRLKGEEYFEILEGAKNISIDLQRKILLARWVYQEKDIYLVDDLFDDLNVAEWNLIYENIIMDELREKTVIFMSYTNLQIKVADHIILFDNGQIVEQGAYHDLLSDPTSELRKVILQDNGEG